VLRRPVELRPSSTAQTPRDPTHPNDRSHKTQRDPSPRPTPTQPRQTPSRKPIPRIRRHQKRLLTITRQKVVGHTQSVLTTPNRPPVYATPTVHCRRVVAAGARASFWRRARGCARRARHLLWWERSACARRRKSVGRRGGVMRLVHSRGGLSVVVGSATWAAAMCGGRVARGRRAAAGCG